MANNAAVLRALKHTGKKITGFLRSEGTIDFSSRVSFESPGILFGFKHSNQTISVNTGWLYFENHKSFREPAITPNL